MRHEPSAATGPGLVRAIGRWTLVAAIINGVVGSGIFGLPSALAGFAGEWSPVAVLVAGCGILVIVLCFAEVGSRFDAIGQIGTLAAVYPATWGIAQLFTGAWSDRVGRKWLIAAGMWVQAVGIGIVILSGGFGGFAAGAALLGMGTAMVYPTLLAAIGDVAHPSWRASSVGVYRLWRDLGYAIGALVAGVTADALGIPAAMWMIAALTLGSGLVVVECPIETLLQDSIVR